MAESPFEQEQERHGSTWFTLNPDGSVGANSFRATNKKPVDGRRQRKIDSLVWMARNHPDKLGRAAKAGHADLVNGQLPYFSRGSNLDQELIECCHLSNFRRDPEQPGDHMSYVGMVEGAVRKWDEGCAKDLELCAAGRHDEVLSDRATTERKRLERYESERAARDEAERQEAGRVAAARRQEAELEQARQERLAREALVHAAEQRQADVDKVVDQLLAEEVGGDW